MKICYGSTRMVLLTKFRAIKLPRFFSWRTLLLGLLANMQEVEFSKTGWPELCPVQYWLPGGFVLVMPRVEPLTDEEFLRYSWCQWRDRGDYVIPVENKQSSFGKLSGEVVAVDYGS